MNSEDIIKDIVRCNVEIATCRFFSFSTATKLQDRLRDIEGCESALISMAQRNKMRNQVRFWSAMLSLFIEKKTYSKRLLPELFYHQPNRDYDYVDRLRLDQYLDSNFPSPHAINSKILMIDGSTRHIPLLDFKVTSQSGHDELVMDCIRSLGLSGYILDSGKSYHFIGEKLISESELIDILAKFVFLDPISDKAWAAHQILERSASLRISARNGHAPILLARL